MKKLHRVGLLLALIITAIICYGVGSVKGATTFLLMGLMLEGAFWFKLLGTKKN